MSTMIKKKGNVPIDYEVPKLESKGECIEWRLYTDAQKKTIAYVYEETVACQKKCFPGESEESTELQKERAILDYKNSLINREMAFAEEERVEQEKRLKENPNCHKRLLPLFNHRQMSQFPETRDGFLQRLNFLALLDRINQLQNDAATTALRGFVEKETDLNRQLMRVLDKEKAAKKVKLKADDQPANVKSEVMEGDNEEDQKEALRNNEGAGNLGDGGDPSETDDRHEEAAIDADEEERAEDPNPVNRIEQLVAQANAPKEGQQRIAPGGPLAAQLSALMPRICEMVQSNKAGTSNPATSSAETRTVKKVKRESLEDFRANFCASLPSLMDPIAMGAPEPPVPGLEQMPLGNGNQGQVENVFIGPQIPQVLPPNEHHGHDLQRQFGYPVAQNQIPHFQHWHQVNGSIQGQYPVAQHQIPQFNLQVHFENAPHAVRFDPTRPPPGYPHANVPIFQEHQVIQEAPVPERRSGFDQTANGAPASSVAPPQLVDPLAVEDNGIDRGQRDSVLSSESEVRRATSVPQEATADNTEDPVVPPSSLEESSSTQTAEKETGTESDTDIQFLKVVKKKSVKRNRKVVKQESTVVAEDPKDRRENSVGRMEDRREDRQEDRQQIRREERRDNVVRRSRSRSRSKEMWPRRDRSRSQGRDGRSRRDRSRTRSQERISRRDRSRSGSFNRSSRRDRSRSQIREKEKKDNQSKKDRKEKKDKQNKRI